jgi:ABC-2 type transport system ATP-binding protein
MSEHETARNEYAIEVENLTKRYGSGKDSVLAVDHVRFTVRCGEIFGFLGPNGAGKTTTQRMLTTLLEPTEGRIVISGHDLARDAYPVKRQMGLVPEEANVYTELTAWENLAFTARLYRVPRERRASRIRDLLQAFGLGEKQDVKVQDFSKGMRRRLSIAMAIVHSPKLLFLDEPTPGLDAQSTRAIRSLIRRLNAQGTTVFLTTHQLGEANQLCDRVAIIDHGRIATVDTPERLKQAFQQVQSVAVALEPGGSTHGQGLKGLPGVSTAVKMGDKWRLYTEDPSALVARVVDYARASNSRVVSLNTLGPTLEDVFLSITGQEVGTVHHGQASGGSQKPGRRGRRGGRR